MHTSVTIITLLLASTMTQAPTEPPATAPSNTDWRAFRGTDGTATSTTAVPTEWSDTNNIAWKTLLPGPGSASPIVYGDSVYLTCWSGYAIDHDAPGEIANLRRHLLRLNRNTGAIVWSLDIEPVATEDPFGGRMSTHGYASNTPVIDDERMYAFFGKAGVYAFDHDGAQLWHADVGTGSSQWLTGSGSSLSLWRDLLFVNASDESHSVRALNKITGEEVWRRDTESLDQSYGTPLPVDGPDGTVLALGILGEIWGLDPETGEMKWSVQTKTGGALAPCVVQADGIIYSLGGKGTERGYAIRPGGAGDVSESHVLWRSPRGPYVTTPLYTDGLLYWADEGGILNCVGAATGDSIFQERLGDSFYASAVRAGDAIYLVSRQGGVHVIAAKPEYELLSHNRIESDESIFDGTPAASDGQLFLRSNRFLYCIAERNRDATK